MELNARMICILQEVVDAEDAVTVEHICTKNDISRRTFYYDIKNVNAWLKENDIQEITLRNGRCSIDPEAGEKLAHVIHESDLEYFMSVDERKIMTSLYIGLSNERIRIHRFCELFDISKNTVLSDMKNIREELRARNIKLQYDNHQGYCFSGNEYAIRNYLYRQFKKVRSIKTTQYIHDFINNQLAQRQEDRGTDYWEALKECLVIYEEVAKTSIVENDTDGCVFIIAMAYLRSSRGYTFNVSKNQSKELRATLAYEGSTKLFRKMEEYIAMHVVEEEICYTALCFLAMQNFDLAATDKQDPKMVDFTERFLSNLEKTGKVTFRDRDMLKRRMVNHITPMIYRINYGVQLENPIAESVQQDYRDAFAMALSALEKTDMSVAEKITEDELSYLAIYIADGIAEGARGSRSSSRKILIVCAEGVATAMLLRDQMAKLLNTHYEFELASIKHISQVRLNDYIMIVSTVKSELLPRRAIHVSLFLTEENKKSILHSLNHERMQLSLRPEEIMEIVSRHIGQKEQGLTALNIELLNYINEHRTEGA